ncbi:MAG: FtsX-like permease family protein [Gemmatimonadetes bacterium]|nr:FtsX-like permease family protein [Gemmatimonadota bacterium]
MPRGWWTRLRDRLRGLVRQWQAAIRSDAAQRELDEEHLFHIEMETDRLVAEGVPPDEARRRALVAFGGVERFQQQVRESRWTWPFETAMQDARYAVRALLRRPLFAVSAIGTMAVAIGAATTFFSAVEAVLLRPLPVPEPERLLAMEIVTESARRTSVVSLPDYVDFREGVAGTLDLAAHHLSDVTLSDDVGAIPALGMEISSNYFRVLGLTPRIGRAFVEAEAERVDAPPEVMLTHDLWRSRFGSDPDVVGRTLRVNGTELTIVGVAPEGFHGTMLAARPAVFLPLGLYGRLQGRDISDRFGVEWLQPLGRLAPDVAQERAAEALDLIAARLASAHDYDEGAEPRDVVLTRFSPIPSGQRDGLTRATLILLAAAVVLLLIAAVNVAGMLLARASQRAVEISVRTALGAARSRLAGQLLVEGLVMGVAAGIGGVGVAALCTRLVGRIRPPGLTGFRLELPLDATVLAFAAACVLATSIVFALIPAYHATRRDVGSAIRGGRSGPAATRGRSMLVGAQVALTLVLLVSTGLLVRTLRNATGTDHGFDPGAVVIGEVNLRLNGYDSERAQIFYASLLKRLEASPDIASAALSTSFPLGSGWDQTRASVPGVESPEPSGWPVGWAAVSESYFETLGFELLAGTPPDRTAVPPRIVVNQELARRLWNDDAPVGRTFRFDENDAAVAGVVPTGKYRAFSEEPRLFAWFPLALAPSLSLYVHVRPARDQAAAVAALRGGLASLDSNVPLISVTTLEGAMGQSLFFQRAAAAFIGVFAVFALLLSATGIFGLLAFTVEQRRREIGIRMAMGSSGSGIVGSVVRKGLVPVFAGLVLGFVAAAGVGQGLRGLLYDVAPGDPVSFVAAGLLLLAVAAVAVWMPALRATRVDPAAALNEPW